MKLCAPASVIAHSVAPSNKLCLMVVSLSITLEGFASVTLATGTASGLCSIESPAFCFYLIFIYYFNI